MAIHACVQSREFSIWGPSCLCSRGKSSWLVVCSCVMLWVGGDGHCESAHTAHGWKRRHTQLEEKANICSVCCCHWVVPLPLAACLLPPEREGPVSWKLQPVWPCFIFVWSWTCSISLFFAMWPSASCPSCVKSYSLVNVLLFSPIHDVCVQILVVDYLIWKLA